MSENQTIVLWRPIGTLLRLLQMAMLCVLMLTVGAMGQANAEPNGSAVWEVLKKGDRDRVLALLAKELVAVQQGIGAKVKADAQASKTLAQLLDDVYHPEKEDAWRKYSSKYAKMAATALSQDPIRFARMAGKASAGDYAALQLEMPRVGAKVFAELVSDVLKDKGMDQTLYVWKAFVSRAGGLKDIGAAYMLGNVDEAFALGKAQVENELKSFTENSIAGVINWVFKDFGMSPGRSYIEAIRHTQAFIEISQKITTAYYHEDCLKKYVKTYDSQSGGPSAKRARALEAYNDCSTLGGYAFPERQLAGLIKEAVLDQKTIVLPMLEAYREDGQTPRSWILDFHAKKIARLEAALRAELEAARTDVGKSSDAFVEALGQRLATLAQEALTKEELDKLLADARKAMADSKRDADAAINGGAGIVALCGEFQAAKARAIKARDEMRRLDSVGADIRRAANRIPECRVDAAALAADLARARVLRDTVDGAVADAVDGFKATCTAKDSIATAPDKPTARQFLQTAQDAAAQTASAVEIGTKAHDGFKQIIRNASERRNPFVGGMTLPMIRDSFAEMDSNLAGIQPAELAQIESDFANAKTTMETAQRRASSLLGHINGRAERAINVLKPHRSGPLGVDVKALLEQIEQALGSAKWCSGEISKEWGATDSTRGWRVRDSGDVPDLAQLETLISKAKARCQVAMADSTEVAPEDKEILQLYTDAKAGTAYMAVAKRGYERCLAEAFVLYSDLWGKPVSQSSLPSTTGEMVEMPDVIGLRDKKAAALVRAAGLIPRIERKGIAHEFDMNPDYVYHSSVLTYDLVPARTTVILTTYGDRPKIEVPVVRNMTPIDAQKVLEKAGFTAIDISLGLPAPSADQEGMVYTSIPAHPAKHFKFGLVKRVIYGPPKITAQAVPRLQGMSAKEAGAALAAYGDHFVLGSIKLSPERPEGSKLGNVHFTTPAAGRPVPKGTVVTLFVYPPLKEEIGDLREVPYEIIGIPAGHAADILRGTDNFFEVLPLKDGDAAQDGQTAGNVQSVNPAAGTFALRGSAVQLTVFKEAEQEIALQACPDPNADPSSSKHRIESNNNPDDQTYLDCSYYKDGALRTQIPYSNGEYDGVWLGYVRDSDCGGRFLTSKEIYVNGKREESSTYLCNSSTSTTYRSELVTYTNGVQASSTRWHSNGVKSSHTDYDSKGKPALDYNYNQNGEFTYCTQWDSKGNPSRCKQ